MASLQSIGALYNSLTAGSKIIGTVVTDSDFRIDGIVEGDVQCKGKIVIGEKGAVQGDLSCQNADVLGCIEGAIKVDGTLSLRATGSINGNVQTKVLIVEPKAQFNGSCSMKQVAPEPKKGASEHTDKEPKKEEPKKQEPKKEEPKVAPKKNEPKAEPKKEQPKKEEPKVKELDLKVEEVKVADIKVEEPVLAVNESSIGNGQEENIITFIDDEPEIVAVEA
jgi:cytoskeletal protein CcmA (bactofilin family)